MSLPALERALADERWAVRAGATSALRLVGGDRALTLMSGSLTDQDERVRRDAVSALSATRDPAATAQLIAALTDPASMVSEQAAAVLGAIGDRAAILPLKEALNRGNAHAGEALGRFDPPDVGFLVEAMGHRDWTVRFAATAGLQAAAYTLARTKSRPGDSAPPTREAIMEALSKGTHDERQEVRARAREALRHAR
jgi:HEAT repeat protein